ncbi:2-hydroxychromene-2-carboxylate isomerase [Paraburkholderia phenazinium]|jgi:2-hydroxychromene-2-carboxylate isomerase|uniref:2-hydroxychromene-2-carboxylate isomerase n=1 Tax=Paraburkholderia phenazinium TaxID=60549 RepID=A0A1G8P7K1_9BURK|nr:2-hydroxychromene-2-carboxylate isomerase [Paraburkholderia phenazinium]SDI88474.1 2-hydroxychromene-2-carboxylate isomerase [Paraburkholderia phenazinium]
MAKQVEFYFDVGSPAAYLAWTQLPGLCAQRGAELVYKPMLLGGVFKATGNASPAVIPAKGRYVEKDYERHASRYGVPLTINPHFPIITLHLMRAVTGVQMRHPERLDGLLKAVFEAMWVDGLNLNESEVTVATLAKAGFGASEIEALANDPQVKEVLKQNTEEAVRRGVFGAPTMFVNGEMFFGQDRLEFVREALG